MPSASKKQSEFMRAIAHSPSFAKKVGVPQSVGRDFSAADKGRKFAEGGAAMAKKMPPFMGKETKAEEAKEMKVKSKNPAMYRKGEKAEGVHGKSGKMKPSKYFAGGPVPPAPSAGPSAGPSVGPSVGPSARPSGGTPQAPVPSQQNYMSPGGPSGVTPHAGLPPAGMSQAQLQAEKAAQEQRMQAQIQAMQKPAQQMQTQPMRGLPPTAPGPMTPPRRGAPPPPMRRGAPPPPVRRGAPEMPSRAQAFAKGGSVRGDGCATKGKTRGKVI